MSPKISIVICLNYLLFSIIYMVGNIKIFSVQFYITFMLAEKNVRIFTEQITNTIFLRHPVYLYIYIHIGITEEYIIYDKIYAYMFSQWRHRKKAPIK